MKPGKFVVYWHTGTNTHHYFDTYDEAKRYLINNNFGSGNIAYLLASVRGVLDEYSTDELCLKNSKKIRG